MIKKTFIKLRKHYALKSISNHPKIPLAERHVENSQLILNREVMLQRIGRKEIVAELGVDKGDFSELIIRHLKPKVFHLVDVWESERYNEGIYDTVKKRFESELDNKQVIIHRKLSTEASSDFKDGYFDFIYIDTDHSYLTTKKELHAFAPKVKPGGVIAGHDYELGNWIQTVRYGVIEAVHEFCVHNNWEIIYLTAEPLEARSFAIRKIL